MTTISDAFESVFRDFVTDGVPASGAYEPPKPDIRALGALIEAGAKIGVPLAATLSGSNIEIVCGVIRRDATDKTKWNYINDSGHVPVGVSGDYATAASSGITINYAKTYSRVIGFICGPDETFSNAFGIVMGSSVGTSSATIKASIDMTMAGICRYDGTSMVTTMGTGQGQIGAGDFPAVTVTQVSSNITITHSYLPGVDISLTPFNNNASIVPKIPMIRSANNTSLTVQMMDPTTGTLDTSVDTTWSFYFRKNWRGGIVLDGTETGGTWPLADGNIWFFGIFEV